MTKLSVNINKIATLRNSRGGNNPDVLKAAVDCQKFGADGITVHPRPDERHIRYSDVKAIKEAISVEFNIEGNPTEEKFVDLIMEVLPTQVTLVPDEPDQLTSNHGWDTVTKADYLKTIIAVFKEKGIRVSIFVDPIEEMIVGASATGTDRVELYTESYARHFAQSPIGAVSDYIKAASVAATAGLGVNAGHDLDMRNLGFFKRSIPNLLEVSIGHALISDAIYYGLNNTIQMYKREMQL